MNDFRQHMQGSPNVVLHVAELAYGDRPFEVTGADSLDIQLRTSHELWHKENILNRAIQRFPAGWQYGAIIDADFHMTRPDWALEGSGRYGGPTLLWKTGLASSKSFRKPIFPCTRASHTFAMPPCASTQSSS